MFNNTIYETIMKYDLKILLHTGKTILKFARQ